MSLRRNLTTGEIREISDEQIAAWLAAGNPKGAHYSTQWEAYTPPEPEPVAPPVPEQVTKRQLLHWLEFDHGVADPEALIPQKIDDAFPPATLPRENHFAQREWSRAQNVRRDNALVPLLAAVLQIADVDAAFREMEEKYG